MFCILLCLFNILLSEVPSLYTLEKVQKFPVVANLHIERGNRALEETTEKLCLRG